MRRTPDDNTRVRRCILATIACFLVAIRADAAEWTSLRTEHFLLIGDASPRAIKDVALRFEQFRAAVASAFPVLADSRPGPPVIVIVFRDQRSYEPYKPKFNGKTVQVGGYFLGSRDVNYITLAADSGGDDFRALYHEYTHLLLQRISANLSPWFNEGLAEFFSTFDASGNTARFGRPIESHVGMLRERQMHVPELFAVTQQSTTYNEGDRRSLFYAQSWLLMHYTFVENRDRWKQLVQFEQFVERGATPDAAFQQAFAMPTDSLDKELLTYVLRPAMRVQVVELNQRVVNRLQTEPVRVAETEAHARLGDLLVHAARYDEAAPLLNAVLKTTPDLPLAHAAMGRMLLRQDKRADAMTHLERAAAAPTADEFVQFYYGAALLERGSGQQSGGDADVGKAIVALERAVQLHPGFIDADRLLGYAYLYMDDASKARDALRRTLDQEPGNEEVILMLAEAYIRLAQFTDARDLLGPLVGRAANSATKERARDLLARSVGVEQQQQLRTRLATESATSQPEPTPEPPIAPPPGRRTSTLIPAFRKLEAGETRTYGLFTEVECTRQQIVLHVRSSAGMLLLRAVRFDAIDFISYRSTTPGTISCGARRPAEDVYVTWRSDEATFPSGSSQGIVVAVELLPDGFVPAP